MLQPSENHSDSPEPQIVERRFYQRHLGRARILVYRDADAMRVGLEAELDDVSVAGMRFTLGGPLDVGEPLKLRVMNDVQRFQKEVRAIVRWGRPSPNDEGRYQVGVELLARLTSLDLQMLRRVGAHDEQDDQRYWL